MKNADAYLSERNKDKCEKFLCVNFPKMHLSRRQTEFVINKEKSSIGKSGTECLKG